MIRKMITILLVGLLVYSEPIHAQIGNQKVEVFDIEQEMVIKEAPLTTHIQEAAEKYLANISGVYKKINPIPDKGIIVRIPLHPSVTVRNQWIHTMTDELTVIFPIGEDPFIMIYDDEHHVYFFTINHFFDHDYLIKQLRLSIKKVRPIWIGITFNFIVL